MPKGLDLLLALAGGALMALAAAVPLPPLGAFAFGAVAVFLVARLIAPRAEEAGVAPAGIAPSGEVTEEADSEAAMLSSAFAQALVESLPTPLLIIARGGRISFANSAARAALPRVKAGEHFAGVIRAPAFVEAVTATLAEGGERTVEFTTHRDRERFFEARVARLPPSASFGPEEQVIARIDDRTQARRADQLRSDFIANASHELRTPLAAVIGYIETLQNHARDDPEARERFLGIMAREAGRMRRLVDDLMSLSRIEMNEHLRPAEQWSLTQIAAESATALLPVAAQEGVTLSVELAAGGGLVLGDRDQLAQVFSNLVDNAMKYGGRGSAVRIFPAEPSRANPNRIGISVSDTGPGIPREHLHRLTERFYRVNASQSRNKGGTGLGLAIVKHILNRHGGRLEITSTLGEGSTFTVWMPREAEEPSATPEARALDLRSA